MPQFKIAKSKDIKKLQVKPKVEDKMYILKETNDFGRLYYDYDENTRLEIGCSNNIYDVDSSKKLLNACEILELNDIRKINCDNTKSPILDIKEVQINSLVINNKSIYNIRAIDRENNTIIVVKIHEQKDLMWNDYYPTQGEYYDGMDLIPSDNSMNGKN